MNRRIALSTIIFLLFGCFWVPMVYGEELMPRIAKWYDNKEAAVSLRFDDNLESHVRTVIPLLSRYRIKGTFMVNPGKSSFKHHEEFWTVEVPKMGHILGNHTMNHIGAKDFKAAEYEIGEATRIIRQLYQDRSPLMVFASGGGEKWGGKKWSKATSDFKNLVTKFDLIDLYDGKHDAFSVHKALSTRTMIEKVEENIEQGSHLPVLFHHVGTSRVKDIIKAVLGQGNYSFPADRLELFLEYLGDKRDAIWVAPLINILKYENERDGAIISVLNKGEHEMKMYLEMMTNPYLYDQPLTILFPDVGQGKMTAIQGGHHLPVMAIKSGISAVNVLPKTSEVVIREVSK